VIKVGNCLDVYNCYVYVAIVDIEGLHYPGTADHRRVGAGEKKVRLGLLSVKSAE